MFLHILEHSTFTATVDPTDGISKIVDVEEDLEDSKFKPMKNCTRFLRSMRNYIGWPPRS